MSVRRRKLQPSEKTYADLETLFSVHYQVIFEEFGMTGDQPSAYFARDLAEAVTSMPPDAPCEFAIVQARHAFRNRLWNAVEVQDPRTGELRGLRARDRSIRGRLQPWLEATSYLGAAVVRFIRKQWPEQLEEIEKEIPEVP